MIGDRHMDSVTFCIVSCGTLGACWGIDTLIGMFIGG